MKYLLNTRHAGHVVPFSEAKAVPANPLSGTHGYWRRTCQFIINVAGVRVDLRRKKAASQGGWGFPTLEELLRTFDSESPEYLEYLRFYEAQKDLEKMVKAAREATDEARKKWVTATTPITWEEIDEIRGVPKQGELEP